MSTSDHLSDAISAASLVLAVLAALYTLWLPAVTTALDLKPASDPDDRGPQRGKIMSAILTKAMPLSLAAIASISILAPRGAAIIVEIWHHHAEWAFDDVKAMFVLTLALMLLLAIVSVTQLVRLVAKYIETCRS
ncbi:hypothetical protein G6M78_15115 [Agrobacterium tumefaciens]|uniref:hypothetical protein n=2 Tax=Agrobacterium tumefaciens TaxID=358 RepID=UPI001572566A|nr:hypothetical protein [Agrobacterium tumefaciens]NTE56406.1 hypothetical protein [Agrobacterium tumefaciens]NTE74374.1 hypothetical protein [Agrobacterium tumefaciens]